MMLKLLDILDIWHCYDEQWDLFQRHYYSPFLTSFCFRYQISGAKVVVHESLPATGDRTIVISGTPDETRAAQSLLQAFILTGSS